MIEVTKEQKARLEREASQNGAGPEGLSKGAELLPAPSAPMEVARKLVGTLYTHSPTGRWCFATGAAAGGCGERAVGSRSSTGPSASPPTSSPSTRSTSTPTEKPKPWAPNRHKIADLLEALAAVCHLPRAVIQPAWIEGGHDGRDRRLRQRPARRRSTRELLAHDPRFFNQTAVPFAYDPQAPQHQALARVPGASCGRMTRTRSPRFRSGSATSIAGRLDLHKILLAGGADPRRQGSDRPRPGRPDRPRERRRADTLKPRR